MKYVAAVEIYIPPPTKKKEQNKHIYCVRNSLHDHILLFLCLCLYMSALCFLPTGPRSMCWLRLMHLSASLKQQQKYLHTTSSRITASARQLLLLLLHVPARKPFDHLEAVPAKHGEPPGQLQRVHALAHVCVVKVVFQVVLWIAPFGSEGSKNKSTGLFFLLCCSRLVIILPVLNLLVLERDFSRRHV